LENLAHVEARNISSTPRISGPGHHDRRVLDTTDAFTLTEIRLPITLSPFGSIGIRYLPITNIEIDHDHVRYKISELLRLARWFKANLQSRLWLALLHHQSHNPVDRSMLKGY
jgi:hypothetical protein